jgi:phosphoserine phosphatase
MSLGDLPCVEHAPGLWVKSLDLPLHWQNFKLIAFDMDSTLINIECIDEVADAAWSQT